MKLFIPHNGELEPADAHLARLAEFLGIRCEPVRLYKQTQHHAEFMEHAFPEIDACLAINPQVVQKWIGCDTLPPGLVSCLMSRFSHVLVHGVTLDPPVTGIITALSRGALRAVLPITDTGRLYEISSKDFCGPFSGLSFGPVNAANDRVFAVNNDNGAADTLIGIGGHPLMAAVNGGKTEFLFIASRDTADLSTEVGYTPLSDYFSQLIPHAMALRHIFRDSCWQPCEPHASMIIDDPPLWRDYGFLNFESLLCLMEKYNFHSSIAFIPRNYRRNSAHVLRMFRENPRRFSICFHGNDHTQSEFASCNTTFLNTALGIAEQRMAQHQQSTALRCDRVMVFPQGDFSVEAMKVLKSHNFCAAVNTVSYPKEHPVALTLGELAQPAVLRYGGFPLFLRKYARQIKSEEIAFNIFFGRPVLIVEHQDVFRRCETLAEVVSVINSISPGIRWTNLENAVNSSYLKRRTPDGVCHVRVYSGTVRISNHWDLSQRLFVEWNHPDHSVLVDKVLQDGKPCLRYTVDDLGIRLSTELAPSESRVLSVVYRNDYSSLPHLSSMWNAKAFVRRRLCEVRDNYISKNQSTNTLAKTLQRLVFGRGTGPRKF